MKKPIAWHDYGIKIFIVLFFIITLYISNFETNAREEATVPISQNSTLVNFPLNNVELKLKTKDKHIEGFVLKIHFQSSTKLHNKTIPYKVLGKNLDQNRDYKSFVKIASRLTKHSEEAFHQEVIKVLVMAKENPSSSRIDTAISYHKPWFIFWRVTQDLKDEHDFEDNSPRSLVLFADRDLHYLQSKKD